MRILHLVHQYPPDFMGGTELYTQTLAAEQVENGHNVAVFCPAPQNHGFVPFTEEGVRVYRVPLGTRSRTQVFRDTFRQNQLRATLKTVLAEEQPDIVHVQHLMGMPFGLVDLLLEAGIPYVLTLHDYWFSCANAQLLTNTDQTICSGPDRLAVNCGQCALARGGKEGLIWLAPAIAPVMRYRNTRLRAVMNQSGRIIAPTNFVRQTMIDLGAPEDKLIVIRHGIHLPGETLGALHGYTELPGRDRPLQIGYIGSIGWQKGVHVLIEAANKLPPDSVSLTIYGDLTTFPDYAAQLEAMIHGPQIELAGSLSRDDLWTVLAELDLVVLPTLWYETSSLVLDEAFAAGTPVVASRIGVLAEKVDDGINGRLFPAADAAALAQILAEISGDPLLLDHWRAGIPPVRTIAAHVREIEELYQSTLDTV